MSEARPVYLLDSFALLAYLNNESGRLRVEAALEQAEKRQCRILMCIVLQLSICIERANHRAFWKAVGKSVL